ncbi:signal transduction histidine kinase [Friedmanniella endophytica]|uniref:histidine kinase n=1 Tax=Microlunatus kandeliicorticis TaxID=1759536 RepID=A0A7W3P7G7_9ACTN|nr:histidine kinase [Microlunatus kandeliicorticis]MBA8796004.1 signal transduction histidine kinase [Microlunatus kandeliicorticis]
MAINLPRRSQPGGVGMPRPAGRRAWSHLLDASEETGVGRDLPLRGWLFDVVVAVGFVGVGSAFLPVFYPAATGRDFLFVALVDAPLLLRRRLPRVSFALVVLAALAQMITLSPIGIHDAGLLFSLYSLAGYTNRRIGLAGLAGTVLAALTGSATDWWGFIDDRLLGRPGNPLVHALTTVGMILLATASWASGERLRSSRIGLAALADRAATLERERAQQARLAAAAERARIAREMHDVIAHGLSVMIAQADGARYVIDDAPDSAKQALDRISQTGRGALTQMRGLLGLLRSGEAGVDADAGPASGPQPGLDQLDDLLTEAAETGLRVDVRRHGTPPPLPAMTQLTVYRVVQEALTNARKHGGDDVTLGLRFARDHLEVSARNGPADPGRRTQTQQPGHGLTGMSERVAALGGSVTAGPTADGGFRVLARLPYPEHDRHRAGGV